MFIVKEIARQSGFTLPPYLINYYSLFEEMFRTKFIPFPGKRFITDINLI